MKAAAALDDATVQHGLLLETVYTQQQLIDSSLAQLRGHTQGLDAVVREQIERTLVEELGAVIEQSARALECLRGLERAAKLRFACWTACVVLLSAASTALSVWWALPSRAEFSALRLRHAQLSAAIELLEQRGGRIDLRRCGSDQRWCVRVDRRAPAFGEQADYLVIKGY